MQNFGRQKDTRIYFLLFGYPWNEMCLTNLPSPLQYEAWEDWYAQVTHWLHSAAKEALQKEGSKNIGEIIALVVVDVQLGLAIITFLGLGYQWRLCQ